MKKTKFNFGNFLVYLACIAVGISLIVPYISCDGDKAKLIDRQEDMMEGIIVLILIAVILLLNVARLNIITLVGAVIELCYAGYVTYKYGSGLYELLCDKEIGYYVLIISSILLVIVSAISVYLQFYSHYIEKNNS